MFLGRIKFDIQVLVCASLTSRALHHISHPDTFRIHHVPPSVTDVLVETLKNSHDVLKEGSDIQGLILSRFLKEVKNVNSFSTICFWGSDSLDKVQFLLINQKGAFCSYTAATASVPFNMHPFYEILNNLKHMPKQSSFDFSDTVEPQYIHQDIAERIWTKIRHASVSWMQDFCEMVSFVDAGVSYGCHTTDSFDLWIDFSKIYPVSTINQEGHVPLDIAGFIGEMILGYVGYSMPYTWNGMQYSNGIIIPNYAMLGNTYKKSYLNVDEYRPDNYDDWLNRKDIWCYDRIYREYTLMKNTGAVIEMEPDSLLTISIAYVGLLGRQDSDNSSHRVNRRCFQGKPVEPVDSSDDEIYDRYKTEGCPITLDFLAYYVKGLCFPDGHKQFFNAFGVHL